MSKQLSRLGRISIFNFAGRTSLPTAGEVNDLTSLGVRDYSLAGPVVATTPDGVTIRFQCEDYEFEGFAPFSDFHDQSLTTALLDGVSLEFRVQQNSETGLSLRVYSKYLPRKDSGWIIAAML